MQAKGGAAEYEPHRVERKDEGTSPRGLLTREKSGEEIEREIEKRKTFLDSGANIHVFKNKNIFSSLTHDSTRLQTACGGKENNTAQKGQIKNLFYSTGKPAHLHARGEGVVCENLKDNLISVGKMCDNGHTIIFHTGGYTIFEGEVVVQGEGVHAQGRDAKTGLDPHSSHIGPAKKFLGTAGPRLHLSRWRSKDKIKQKSKSK